MAEESSEDFDLDDSEDEHGEAASSSSTHEKVKEHDRDKKSDGESETSASPTKKGSWWSHKKRGIASAAAGSSVGKAAFNKWVDPDTKHLLKAIIKLVELEDSKKKAQQIRKHIMKSAVKVIMLYEDKKVSDADFESMQFLFRRTCSGVRNAYQGRAMNIDHDAAAERIGHHLLQFSAGVIKVIKPFVSQHSLDRIESVVKYLANAEFLRKCFTLHEFETVAMVLTSYLQNNPAN